MEAELLSVEFSSFEHNACFNVLLLSAVHAVFLECQTRIHVLRISEGWCWRMSQEMCVYKDLLIWQPSEISDRLNLLISKGFGGLILQVKDVGRYKDQVVVAVQRTLGNSSC